MAGFIDRVKLSYNVLTNKLPEPDRETILTSYNAAYQRVWRDTSTKVLSPIQTRIAIDVANVPIRHVRIDEFERFLETIPSELNDRLSLKANIDQSGPVFIQDVVMSMLEHGAVAIVPVDVTTNPSMTTAYDPLSFRTGIIEEWLNKSVRLSVYNEAIGDRVPITLPKSYVAMCYNPLYAVMNEPNSTLKRLIDKLALLDFSDNKINSPNLDLILQLPYAIKNDKRQQEADRRLQTLQEQLYKTQYGVAYVDSTEKITQLNRPVQNTLPEQIEYLTNSLHSQLGLTPAVFSGTAEETEMLAYYNRTVEPILKAIIGSMKMTFLTATAIKQKQSIMAFPNIFKMAGVEVIAEAADKFTRNEIMSSNEIRQLIGFEPRKGDPGADELRNKNLNKESEDTSNDRPEPEIEPET